MTKPKITREQLESIYEEIDRRMQIDISDAYHMGRTVYANEIRDEFVTILQGVYATLTSLFNDDFVFIITEVEEPYIKKYVDVKE